MFTLDLANNTYTSGLGCSEVSVGSASGNTSIRVSGPQILAMTHDEG